MLREAFDKVMQDKDLIGEAALAGLDIKPIEGTKIDSLVKEKIATPAAIVARMQEAMSITGYEKVR